MISSINTTCDENCEIARTVLIRNGEIIESECVRSFLVLSTFRSTNIPKMISFPGEHFISFKKLKFILLFNFSKLLYIFTLLEAAEILDSETEHVNR